MSRRKDALDVAVGQRVLSARKTRGLSQRQLAHALGMERGVVANIEHGHSAPSAATLRGLADALDVSTDYLLARTQVTEGERHG
jgi:transcriptional regulator with XRE-family HTH domain